MKIFLYQMETARTIKVELKLSSLIDLILLRDLFSLIYSPCWFLPEIDRFICLFGAGESEFGKDQSATFFIFDISELEATWIPQ